jgi:hypothetical protein
MLRQCVEGCLVKDVFEFVIVADSINVRGANHDGAAPHGRGLRSVRNRAASNTTIMI